VNADESDSESSTTKKSRVNRESCSICRDGGDLILCDGCPKSFHLGCLKLKETDIPEDEWYCTNCIPRIEKRKEREFEKEERRKVKNEKRRLYRAKKREEARLAALKQQNNIININVIVNGKPEALIDLTTENEHHTTIMNVDPEKLNDLIGMFSKSSEDATVDGSKKMKIRYPIPDNELYANPELHEIDDNCFTKPKGKLSNIPSVHFNKIIKIWDFTNSFRQHLQLSFFTPDLLYEALQSDKDLAILNEIHISLLLIFLRELDEIIDSPKEKDLVLLRLASCSGDKRLLLGFTWREVFKIVMSNSRFNLMNTEEVANVSLRLNTTSYHLLSYDEKIILLDYLVDTAISTGYMRNVIKADIIKRNDIQKEKSSRLMELKVTEARKKELERAEKFVNPSQKVENIETKLTNLKEDNPRLSRTKLNDLRKELEGQREEFLSVWYYILIYR
jgi:hypothetical protein